MGRSQSRQNRRLLRGRRILFRCVRGQSVQQSKALNRDEARQSRCHSSYSEVYCEASLTFHR